MDHPPFPPFCLARLLRNTFRPRQGERVCILIDLPDPGLAKGWAFLGDEKFSIQRHAHDSFYNALHEGVMTELGMTGGEFFAYEETGGRSEEHTSELQSRRNLVCRLLLEKKKTTTITI